MTPCMFDVCKPVSATIYRQKGWELIGGPLFCVTLCESEHWGGLGQDECINGCGREHQGQESRNGARKVYVGSESFSFLIILI